MAVSGICSGLFEENGRKIQGKMLEKRSCIAKCFKFWDFGHWERQNCRDLGSTLPGALSQPFVRGVFLKLRVAAFSSFSD